MILTFKGGEKFVRLDIDRRNRKVIVSSHKTNYQPKEVPWKMLFDPGKEEKQDELTRSLNDETFQEVMSKGMQKAGYNLIKVEN